MNKLFEPVRLGPLTLKNRLVMTAMSTCFAGPRGEVNPRLTEYYATRAAGGTALVTVEEASIHPQLPHVKNCLGAYGDHLITGLSGLAGRIHEEGALASIQIGIYFRQQVNGFLQHTVSSEAPFCGPGCKELNREEIRYIVRLFADAAHRVHRAGFDAVEIHACHGCLLSEFLSPYWNKRTDEYGNGRAGRFRFPVEILQEIRSRLGSEYPVLYRISGSEFVPGGFTPEDAVAFSVELEREGVTAINVSGGLGHENHVAIPPSDVPRGLLLPIGKAIRDEVRVPVIVGNSMTPALAIGAIESGQADLIGLGRPLIADPEWPHKVADGRVGDIRQCIRCNQGCFAALKDPRRNWICCMYNPVVGREFESPIAPAAAPKRVVVIGAGPAGCEVARVARLRGHETILIEKADRVGGQFNLAYLPPMKGDFGKLVEFYGKELGRLGVDIRLSTEATPELLQSLHADVFVLATGSTSSRPPVPGVELPHVTTVPEILSGRKIPAEGPAVVIGGGASGLETADFLSEKGIQVTVVEVLDAAGRDIVGGIGVREALMSRLRDRGVTVLTGHRAVGITEDAVIVSDRPLIGGGKETAIDAKNVVLALGMRPVNDLAGKEKEIGGTWYLAGDTLNPGNAYNAIHQAFELALRI